MVSLDRFGGKKVLMDDFKDKLNSLRQLGATPGQELRPETEEG